MHRRLIALARDARLELAVTVLAGLLAGLVIVAQARTFSSIVDGAFLQAQGLPELRPSLRLLLILIAARAALTWLGESAAGALAARVKDGLRRRLLDHLAALGPARLRAERTGELTAAAVEGIQALDAYFGQYLPQLALAALVPLSILAFAFPLDPLSGLVLLLTAPLVPLFMILIGKTAEGLTRRQWETLGRLSAHFLDSLQGLTTLKLFGQSRAHLETIRRVSERFRDTTLSVLRVTFLSALALEWISTLSTAIIAVEIGLRLLYGRLPFQEALFLLVIAPEFYLPLRNLGLRFHAGMAGTAAAARIFAILDTALPAGDAGQDPAPARPGEIAFEGVSFRYSAADEEAALSDLTFTIPAGRHTAIVGASGAGKSTLANLLLRFLEPTAGRITVGGAPLAAIHPDGWRERIAWVPQRPHLFHDTLAANLRLARPEATADELRAAARAAHLDEFIQSLPQGYDTPLEEGGARLSAGQAQRLAIARAFLKDAPILILDEPTSSLDPQTEALIADSLARLMQGRTVITIAHRMSTVRQADHILVLQEGRLVEQGAHADLLARGGRYAALVQAGGMDLGPQPTPEVPAAQAADVARGFVRETLGGWTAGETGPGRGTGLLPRLLGFLHGSEARIALAVLLGSLTVASSLGLLGTSAWLISAAALQPSIAELQVAIVGVRFFGIARGLFRYLERLTSHSVTFNLLARIRIWFYQKLEPLAPARLQQLRSGDLLARAVADVETLENFYVRVVAPPLVAIVITLGVSLFLGRFDPSFALALWILALALGVGAPLLIGLLARGPGRRAVELRADLQARLVDAIQGLPDLLAFGRARDAIARAAQTGARMEREQLRLAMIGGLQNGLSVLCSNLATPAILALAIPLVRAGRLDGVMLAALALLAWTAFEAVQPLPLAAQTLGASVAAAGRLFAVVDARPAVLDPPTPGPGPVSPDLRIRSLRFRYDPAGPWALDGLDLDLPAGGKVAVVGPSGAGKSTLVNLLLRFWDYTEGEIALGGCDVRACAAEDVRRQIAVVGQNTYLFNATVRQNLRLARPEASDAEIESAARRAQIHEFILSLPQGYDTWIGEQGLRLSGGERQRLAIARALLKDAPLLLLDEPTANLDPLTERAILQDILGQAGGRSLLLITHRLIGLEHFDQIVVLDHGRVLERGPLAALLSRGGWLARMMKIQ